MRLSVAAIVVVLLVASVAAAKRSGLPTLAYAGDAGGSLDVYVLSSGAAPRRLTTTRLDEFSPSWSPEGRRIAYRVNPQRSDVGDIWAMRADGRSKRNLTRTPRVAECARVVTRRATHRVLERGRGRLGDANRRHASAHLTRRAGLDEYPSWSPDGRRLAFGSHRDGQFEIYAMQPMAADPSPSILRTISGRRGLRTGGRSIGARREPGRVRHGRRRRARETSRRLRRSRSHIRRGFRTVD